MGEAFSDKEVAFSLCHVIPRQGEDCSFIKLTDWLNAMAERSESAHHHSMTVSKEARNQGQAEGQDWRRNRNRRIHFSSTSA